MDNLSLTEIFIGGAIFTLVYISLLLVVEPDKVFLESHKMNTVYEDANSAYASTRPVDVSDKILTTLKAGDVVAVKGCILMKDLYVYKVRLESNQYGYVSAYGDYSVTRDGEQAYIC